jgi:methylisocitrate lyase
MFRSPISPLKKREAFKKALATGKTLRFPGAHNAMVAMIAQEIGFEGIYVSGGVMANNRGLPDVGLTTLDEVRNFASEIAKMTDLPTIMDIDTGFGEPMNAARTLSEIEYAGLAGCHLEDQLNPKRCGHLDGKQLVSTEEMCMKIKAAVGARQDPNFLLIARTDARGVEGFDAAVARAKAYAEAGADMIFPEALSGVEEFSAFRKAIPKATYLLANMTEFGKSELLTHKQLQDIGFNMVIYPVTSQRLAMKAVEDGFKSIYEDGTQANILDKMQTRSRLYEVVEYEKYAAFDTSIFNFKLSNNQ